MSDGILVPFANIYHISGLAIVYLRNDWEVNAKQFVSVLLKQIHRTDNRMGSLKYKG